MKRKGIILFVIGHKTGHISGRDGIFRSHGQKIGPFPGRHSSRRSEHFGCSSRSLLRIAGWRIRQRWCLILHTPHTLTINPAILYQGVSIFSCFDRFPAHSDEKTEISLLRCIKRRPPDVNREAAIFIVCKSDYARIAAIPGSSLPSRYSSMAPPPVDT